MQTDIQTYIHTIYTIHTYNWVRKRKNSIKRVYRYKPGSSVSSSVFCFCFLNARILKVYFPALPFLSIHIYIRKVLGIQFFDTSLKKENAYILLLFPVRWLILPYSHAIKNEVATLIKLFELGARPLLLIMYDLFEFSPVCWVLPVKWQCTSDKNNQNWKKKCNE